MCSPESIVAFGANEFARSDLGQKGDGGWGRLAQFGAGAFQEYRASERQKSLQNAQQAEERALLERRKRLALGQAADGTAQTIARRGAGGLRGGGQGFDLGIDQRVRALRRLDPQSQQRLGVG